MKKVQPHILSIGGFLLVGFVVAVVFSVLLDSIGNGITTVQGGLTIDRWLVEYRNWVYILIAFAVGLGMIWYFLTYKTYGVESSSCILDGRKFAKDSEVEETKAEEA